MSSYSPFSQFTAIPSAAKTKRLYKNNTNSDYINSLHSINNMNADDSNNSNINNFSNLIRTSYVMNNNNYEPNIGSKGNNLIHLFDVSKEYSREIYNYFSKFGDIENYEEYLNNNCIIIKYKNADDIYNAMEQWENIKKKFGNPKISFINQESRLQIIQNFDNSYNARNSIPQFARQNINYCNNENDFYFDNRTKWEKFLDVLFNL